MRTRELPDVPDPEEQPNAYEDAEQLEALYVHRGWTREQIAEHFDTGVRQIRAVLEEHEITKGEGSRPPHKGPAAKLWEAGRQAAIDQGAVE